MGVFSLWISLFDTYVGPSIREIEEGHVRI